MRKLLFAVIFSLIVLSVAGCGKTIKTDDGKMKVSDKGIQFEDSKGNKAKISNDSNGNMQFEGTNGSISIGDDVKLPEGYPEDILPLYKEDKITFATKTNEGYSVMYTTKESMDNVKKFYTDVFEKTENKNTVDTSTGTMIGGSSDDYELVVSIAQDTANAGKIAVTLAATNKK